MDPMLQRLGDVTIQRLEKPKEAKPPLPIANDNATMEKEKKGEPPPTLPPAPAPVEPTPPPPQPQLLNMDSAKRFYDDLPGPSSKKPRYEDFKPHPDNFSTHSYSDNELSDYEYESELESEPEMPPEMQTVPGVKLEPSSNYEEESQEGSTDFLEKLVQAPFMDNAEIKLEPVSKPDDDYDYDIKEKLKEMGEISFETVKKGDNKPKKVEVKENEVSVVPAKKTGNEEVDGPSGERKGGGGNMRRNIREVMDETKLDESTLAAQRQEMERLRRVQEQQRLIREVQRQMAQERVISLLQGNHLPKPSTSATTRVGNTVLVKLPNGQTKPMTKLSKKPLELTRLPRGAIPPHPQKSPRSLLTPKRPPPSQAHLTPSVSIAPVGKRPMDFSRPPSESDSDNEEMMLRRPVGRPKLKEAPPVQTIDISSDDDCIVVSESENDPTSDEVEDPTNSGMHTNDEFNQPDEQGRVVINIGHPEDESDIYLAPQIARIIKPHQIGGIRFLYDNIIESTNRFETSTGFGCILAHSMGLGKTLQVVTFSDIFLRHTPAKTILCIMPINTLQNWMAEYNMWLPTEDGSPNSPLLVHGEVRPRHFNLHVLNDSHKTLAARAKVIHEWRSLGGVLLIGYEQYRLLSLRKYPKSRSKKPEQRMHDEDRNKALFDEVHEALVKPGPDLVICDEGHRIKNSHASISQALKQMKTKRRVVLTGYPLQNNLMEYWCMVDFVRPNYLGTKTEFCNMFERPIQNGQCIDSTEADIKLMRYRAHVLHSLLLGFVQRRSHRVLQTALPQKEEYVLLCRMSDFQRTLYETFMNEVVRTQTVPNPLKAFAVCCKIWNHPDVLYYFLKKQAKGEAVDIDLEEVSNSTVSSEALATKPKPSRAKRPSARGRKAKPAASVTPYSTNTPPETTPIVPPIETPPNTQPTQIFTTPTKEPPYQNNFEQNNYTQFPPNNQPNNFENNYTTNTFGNSFNTPPTPNNYQNPANSPYQSPPGQNQNYPPNSNNYQQNFSPQNNPAYRNQTYNPQTAVTPYNGQPNNFNNYQNQNYWNPDVKPTGDNNYYGGYNNQYNPNAPSWIKQEDIKTEQCSPESKPKINIISDIKISNVYDSMGNISPEKKINILSDIKLEPKKEEVDFKDETSQTNEVVINKLPLELKGGCEGVEDSGKPELCDSAAIVARNAAMGTVAGKEDTGIPYDWAKELLKDYIPGCIENSAKMEILFCIIKESLALGDRLLVFSQSLITLDLIEQFLQMNVVPSGAPDAQHWAKNTSYYRLDGSTSALEREKLINEFNSNPKVYLFLVSTRAGSLGINLIGANRVVVLDASWNPCHDTQAVCRVYRYGQRKPCFVYRLVVDNCLEKKIYDRQINKQGMSDRVVDECNPDAHLTMKDVSTLCWDDDKETEERDWSHTKDNYIDVVLQKVLVKHGRRLNKEPFQHESLLVDRKEKQLSKQEKRLAKKGYEREKQATRQPSYGVAVGARGHRPVASVRPMQQGGERPTRWIPAEHWQRQGMTAQEMTLPLDVVIPTNQPDKGNIVLKAGQKVLVLKSPKGVYMQLESGKIVAIKTAIKMRGKAEEEASKAAKAGLPVAIKNNSALTVLPTLPKRPVKPFSPGMTKFNMRSVKQAVPNIMSMHKMSKKVQMAKTRPYQMNELAKSMRGHHHDLELHPSSSEDEKSSPEKRLSFPFRGEGQISLLKPHGMIRSESDNDMQRSEEDSSESSKDSMQQHHFKGVGKATSSSALRQLEESTSAIISEKQPFQDTLDSITSSYQEDKSEDHTIREESQPPQAQPIQIEDDSPVECDENYDQSSVPPPVVPETTVKSDIPPPDYGYNNYYGYSYPHPPPPQGYPPYPQQPPYDVYPPPPLQQQPPQQQPPPYNYGMYPQGYPPQPQYPPPPPQPYEYAPPPPQPIYSGYPPYPPQQYPPPPPQGMYPPQTAAPYPDYNYPAAPPPPVAPSYYPPQS